MAWVWARRVALRSLAVGLAVVLAACGGGADRTKAQVRLVNATLDYASLEMRVDGSLRQGAAYGASAAYVEVDPGKAETTITQPGSAAALLSFTPAVAERRHFTVLAFGRLGALRQLTLDDNLGAPAENRTLLRVINAAPDAGNLDVFVTGNDDPIAGAVPAQAGAAFGNLGEVRTLTSGTWRLRVTAANDPEDLRLDLRGLVLGSRQVLTLVITPGSGGVLVHSLLLAQQGGITAAGNTSARVRVVAGLAAGGTVGARLGDVALLGSQVSPAVTAYRTVPAGNATLGLTVNGQPLAGSVFHLVAGSDYTLMVHGEPAAARSSWLLDDNRPALSAGQARLRLVNGVAGASGPLSMTLDFNPLADGLDAGAASAYRSNPAVVNGQIAVSAAGTPNPLFSAGEQIFAAGGVYSVMVVGSAHAPTGIVRRDR